MYIIVYETDGLLSFVRLLICGQDCAQKKEEVYQILLPPMLIISTFTAHKNQHAAMYMPATNSLSGKQLHQQSQLLHHFPLWETCTSSSLYTLPSNHGKLIQTALLSINATSYTEAINELFSTAKTHMSLQLSPLNQGKFI